MNTLDSDRLEAMIVALQGAKQANFRFGSSPTRILLETAIDLLLVLSDEFLSIGQGEKINQDLKFLDLEKPDALGNSRSIKMGPSQVPPYHSGLASHILKMDLVPFLIQIKRQKYVEAFLGLKTSLALLSNSDEVPRSEPKNRKAQARSRNKEKTVWKQKAYHQRRRQRK